MRLSPQSYPQLNKNVRLAAIDRNYKIVIQSTSKKVAASIMYRLSKLLNCVKIYKTSNVRDGAAVEIQMKIWELNYEHYEAERLELL
jgi:hypothetical protein